jgi:hypothetical protein
MCDFAALAPRRVLRCTCCVVFLGLSVVGLVGCGDASSPEPSDAPATAVVPDADPPEQPPVVPDVAPQPSADELLDEAAALVDGDDLAGAEAKLAELRDADLELAPADQQRLVDLEVRIDEIREAAIDRQREAKLAAARTAVDNAELEAATAAIEEVLAANPSPEQAETAQALKDEIESQRRAQRELRSAIRLLESDKRSDVKAARTQLWEHRDVALPLLLRTLAESANPVLTENVLELLRQFDRPERTLPAVVAVLSRAEQSASWPAAVREIERAGVPGAGEPLLKLALDGATPEQRLAALLGLAAAVDPPPRTLVALLPRLYADGPELAASLTAALHAVQVLGQHDLAARRGLEAELSTEDEAQLAGLGARLQALITAGDADGGDRSVAEAATKLAIATRLVEPQPLLGVTVSRQSAEDAIARAANVLDGVWNTNEAANLWRHPVDKPPQIVLDLGTERTVAAVRIWNYNEPNAGYRGWKEVEIFVSPTPALLTPVAEGIVPIAPGANQTPDYSVTIAVPFVRGRYVKLQPRTRWHVDGPSGLAEVQVLGF